MNELHAATHAPLPRYATDKEIAEKNAAIEEARAVAKQAEQAEGAAMSSRHGAGQQLNEALEKMAALEREEVRLRHALAGTSYVDPELGLVVK